MSKITVIKGQDIQIHYEDEEKNINRKFDVVINEIDGSMRLVEDMSVQK